MIPRGDRSRERHPRRIPRIRRRVTHSPSIEGLEDRTLLAMTYHNWPLLSDVQVNAVFYGSDWNTNPTLVSY